MWLDLIALGVFAYLMLSGARHGALVSFLRAFSLLGAYLAAFLLGPLLAPRVAQLLGAPALVGTAVAGTAVFFAAAAVLGAITSLARRYQKHRDIEQPRHPGDRAAGAFFGALQGAFVVLVLGVLAGWIQVGRKAGPLADLPDPGGHNVAAAAQKAIETAADVVLDENNAPGRAAARLAARPDRALEDAHKLMHNPAVERLQQDPTFWTHLDNGAIDQALETQSFVAFTQDAEVRDSLANYGLLSPEDARDPERVRQRMRPVLEQIGPRVHALRNDPALHELATDPATSGALRSGNTLALLKDSRFRALLKRAMDATPAAAPAPSE